MRSRARRLADDPTVYPVELKMGEDSLHRAIMELLRPLVERWLARSGKPSFVGADQFVYFKQFEPTTCVAPDLYVLPGVAPGVRVKSWKTWESGVVPSFALEVVTSADAEKDYRESPVRYGQLGVDELIVFDADAERFGGGRVRWQRYRKLKKRGFVRVEASDGDRIRSRALGCFLRVVGARDATRLRLASGRAGEDLFPTEAEAERAALQVERAAKEAERAAKEDALRELAALRRLLESGRGK